MPGGWSVPCSCPNSPRSQLGRLDSLAGEPKGERDSFLDACFAPRSPLRSKEADSPLGLIIGRLKRAHGSPIRFQKEFGSFSARANRHENGNLHEEAMLASRRQEKERRVLILRGSLSAICLPVTRRVRGDLLGFPSICGRRSPAFLGSGVSSVAVTGLRRVRETLLSPRSLENTVGGPFFP